MAPCHAGVRGDGAAAHPAIAKAIAAQPGPQGDACRATVRAIARQMGHVRREAKPTPLIYQNDGARGAAGSPPFLVTGFADRP
jgi:hypothetical protein